MGRGKGVVRGGTMCFARWYTDKDKKKTSVVGRQTSNLQHPQTFLPSFISLSQIGRTKVMNWDEQFTAFMREKGSRIKLFF